MLLRNPGQILWRRVKGVDGAAEPLDQGQVKAQILPNPDGVNNRLAVEFISQNRPTTIPGAKAFYLSPDGWPEREVSAT
jgi:hypothetical protein